MIAAHIPVNEEVEFALVSSVLHDAPGVGPRVFERVAESDIAHPGARAVYATARRLVAERKAIDYVTLHAELGEATTERIGGQPFLARLYDFVPSPVNWESYVGTIERDSRRRRMIEAARDVQRIAMDADADHLSEARARLSEFFRAGDGGSRDMTWHQYMLAAVDEMEEAKTARMRGSLPGIDTGLAGLNEMTGGWRTGDLIVEAARPSCGKTALLGTHARAAAHSGARVGIFSAEMGGAQIAMRALAAEARVNLHEMRNGTLADDGSRRVTDAVAEMRDLGIYLDTRSGLTVEQFAAKATRWREVEGVGIVFVDYLQLMRSPGARAERSRVLEVGEISRALKGAAMDLRIPVIAACQLNRESERRQDGRPLLSDLRDSGDIEQDADMVILLHSKRVDQEHVHSVDAIIAKHRNGPTGVVPLTFDRRFTQFMDGADHR